MSSSTHGSATILDLPEPIVWHIAELADSVSAIQLSATCKQLYKFIDAAIPEHVKIRLGADAPAVPRSSLLDFRDCFDESSQVSVRIATPIDRSTTPQIDFDEDTSPTLTELVHVTNGDSTIELVANTKPGKKGDYCASYSGSVALRVHGTMAAYGCDRSENTMLQFFYTLDQDAIARADFIRAHGVSPTSAVAFLGLRARLGAISFRRPLSAQFAPLLARLRPGHYTLEYHREWAWYGHVYRTWGSPPAVVCMVPPPDDQRQRRRRRRSEKAADQVETKPQLLMQSNYVGYSRNIIYTFQHRSTLDRATVSAYVSRIRRCYGLPDAPKPTDQEQHQEQQQEQQRPNAPYIYVIGFSNMYFVLDGHHKLAAYAAVGVIPAAVVITPTADALGEGVKELWERIGKKFTDESDEY